MKNATKRKRISQREARQLRKRVLALAAHLKAIRTGWFKSYPGGTNICSMQVVSTTTVAIDTARKLGHAVVVVNDESTLRFYALPVASETEIGR